MRSTKEQRGKQRPKGNNIYKRKYRGITRLARRCKTDGGLRASGHYYPNYRVTATDVTNRRPHDSLVDSSLDAFLSKGLREAIVKKAKGSGLMYITDESVALPETSLTSASWWILEHSGKRVIVTALHAACSLKKPKFYLLKDLSKAEHDVFQLFKQEIETNTILDFFEVVPNVRLLKARKEWIETNYKEPGFADVNIDAEFGLQPLPILDIMFFDVPDSYASLPSFSVTKSPRGNVFIHLAYHHVYEYTESDLYVATTDLRVLPSAVDLLNEGRSISLGKIQHFGPIATVLSTNAEQSSGGAHLDENLEAFGIGIASFYDAPDEDEQTEPPVIYDTELTQLINFDYLVTEKGDPKKTESRNRNLVLTFAHPGVQHLLSLL